MPVLVDTNVICDVLYRDPRWEAWSDSQINQHKGNLWINPLVYAELAAQADSSDQVDLIVETLGLHYEELPREALFLAAQAHRAYRLRGGSKTSPLPDFFIGAHAQAAGLTLLTRDTQGYQTYFPKVCLISP